MMMWWMRLQKEGVFFLFLHFGKTRLPVLVGDYLLAKGLLLSLENKDFKILEILSDAVKINE